MLKNQHARSILPYIENDLDEKFVFLAGPRQVGKTTVSKTVLNKIGGKYYNWDDVEDREKILNRTFLNDSFVVFDELHKYLRWKNWLKGIYDKHHENLKILITGSARLDVYQRGDDSLFGRYFLHHLYPFSLSELMSPQIKKLEQLMAKPSGELLSRQKEAFENLYQFGGFPEPLFKASPERYLRWSRQRRELILQEELRDLTKIHSLSLLEHLMLLLPARAASILSIQNLHQEIQVAYNTIVSWIDVLARLYFLFLVPPFTHKLSRSVKKEKKIYLWNWADVSNEGARFENMVALHLHKTVQVWNDLGFGDFSLHFIRDRDQKEIDFCLTNKNVPILLIEVKLTDVRPSEQLVYYSRKLNCPALQLVKTHQVFIDLGHVQIRSASDWFMNLA